VSFEPCAWFILRCDGCGVVLGEEYESHFPSPDPADRAVAEEAWACGWTTDGEHWHCQECPELRSPVCRACLAGLHCVCEDADCACALTAVTPGQGVLPGLGEASRG
jgi:hypothetical protein